MAGLTLNMGYLKSILGILKIVEFVLLLLAFSCMSDCCYTRYYQNSRVSFFLAVTVIGWLIVIALFVFFFLNLIEKVPQVNWNLTNLIVSIVFAVLLLICSSLMAEQADYLSYWKKYVYYNNYYERIWNTMTVSVVFGFFAIVAFIIDAVFQFKAGISSGGGGNSGQVSNTQNA